MNMRKIIALITTFAISTGPLMAEPRDFRMPETRGTGNGLRGAERERIRDGGDREVRPAATNAQENGARQYARGTAVQTSAMPVYSSRTDGNFVFSGNASQMSGQMKNDLRAAFRDAATHGDAGAVKLMDAIGWNDGDAGNGNRVNISFTPPTNADPAARTITGTNAGTVALANGGSFTINRVSDTPDTGGAVASGATSGPLVAGPGRTSRDGGNSINNGRDYARGTPVQTGSMPVYQQRGNNDRPFVFSGDASQMSPQMKNDVRAAFRGAAENGDTGSINLMNAVGWNDGDAGNGGRVTIEFQVPTGGATAGDRGINAGASHGNVVTLNNGASFSLQRVTDPNAATAAAPVIGGGAAPAPGRGGAGGAANPAPNNGGAIPPINRGNPAPPANGNNANPPANGGNNRRNNGNRQNNQPQQNAQGAQNAQVRGAAGWALNQNGGGNAVVQPGRNGAATVTATFNQLSPAAQQEVRAIAAAAGNGGPLGAFAAVAQALIDNPDQSFTLTVAPAQNGAFRVTGVAQNNAPANAAVGQAAGFAVAPPQAGRPGAPVAAQPLANGNVMLTMRAGQMAPAARQQLQQIANNAGAPAGARAAANAVLNARPDQMITIAVNPAAAGGPRVTGADRVVGNAAAPQGGANAPVAPGAQAQPRGGQAALVPNPAAGLLNPAAGGVVLVAQQRNGAVQVTGTFNQLTPEAQAAVNALPPTDANANRARLGGNGSGTFTFTRGNDGALRATVASPDAMLNPGAPGTRVLDAALGKFNDASLVVGMIRPDGKIQMTTTAGNLSPQVQQQMQLGGVAVPPADTVVTLVVTPANGAAQPEQTNVVVGQVGQAPLTQQPAGAANPAAGAINANARGVIVVQPQANGAVVITGNINQLSPQLQGAVQAQATTDGRQSAAGQAANGARMSFTLTPDAANPGQFTLSAVAPPQVQVAANLTQGLLNNNANNGPVIVQAGANPNLTQVTVNTGALTDAGRRQLQQSGIQVPDNANTPITLTIDTSVRGRPEVQGPNGGGLQLPQPNVNAPAAQNPGQVVAAAVARPNAAIQVLQQAGGPANRFQAVLTPMQMNAGARAQIQGMAQANPDQRVGQAVNALLNGNRPVTVTVEVNNGAAQITGISVPAQGNRGALALNVNAQGALALAPGNNGLPNAPPVANGGNNGRRNNAGPALIPNAPVAGSNIGAVVVPLNRLRPQIFAANMPPLTSVSLNTRNIGQQFGIALRGIRAEGNLANRPAYQQAVALLTNNGYNAATNRFAAPVGGASAADLRQAWVLIDSLRR